MSKSREALEMIDELVRKYGQSAEQIIATGLNLDKKGHNYRCPDVHSHKNGDKNPSMGWVKDKFYFNCLGCGENISIYTYYKNYLNYSFAEIMSDEGIEGIEEKRSGFKKSVDSGKKKLSAEQIEFINARGITAETIGRFKLVNWNGDIGIPYFKNGVLVGLKRRILKPQEGKPKNLNVAGSKPFFFNCDNVEYGESLIVVEGEWDCMILDQCGFKNVVSVGCGANALRTLFDQSEDFIKRFPEIILVSDNDKYGNEMDIAFIDEFEGKIATVNKSLYLECKDANEVFLKHGIEQIKDIVSSGKLKFDGEWDLDSNPYKELKTDGYKFIPTGIQSVDHAINDIQTKSVTLVTGRSNAGKSTFVNQIMGSAIDSGNKVYLVAGEGDPDKIINKFYMQLVGHDERFYDLKKFNIRWIKEPKRVVLKAIQDWHKGKLKMFVKSMSKYKTEDQLFDMLKYKLDTEHYDLVILDNLMSLLTISKSSEKNDLQAKFVERCHHLAKSTNSAIILVLHPNKTYSKGTEMDFEQIAGTSDISNKADVILNVIRVPDDDCNGVITSKIQIAKNRDWPELPTVDCNFDVDTNTYSEVQNGSILKTVNSGWQRYFLESKGLEVPDRYKKREV